MGHLVINTLVLIFGLFGATDGVQPDRSITEEVAVHHIAVDVRVLDGAGRPIKNLEASDFTVKVEGRYIPVASLDWVRGANPPPGRC